MLLPLSPMPMGMDGWTLLFSLWARDREPGQLVLERTRLSLALRKRRLHCADKELCPLLQRSGICTKADAGPDTSKQSFLGLQELWDAAQGKLPPSGRDCDGVSPCDCLWVSVWGGCHLLPSLDFSLVSPAGSSVPWGLARPR